MASLVWRHFSSPRRFISQKPSLIAPHCRESSSARSIHPPLTIPEGSTARDRNPYPHSAPSRGDSLHNARRECVGHCSHRVWQDRGCSPTSYRQDGPRRESTRNLAALHHSSKSTKPRPTQAPANLVGKTRLQGRG